MKKTVIVAVIIIFASFFSGCGASTEDITGLWYDKAGLAGTLEFKDGGTVTLTVSDQTYNGTYIFDVKKGSGIINITDPITSDGSFKLSNGEINVGNGTVIYSRDKSSSKDIGEIIKDLTSGSGN